MGVWKRRATPGTDRFRHGFNYASNPLRNLSIISIGRSIRAGIDPVPRPGDGGSRNLRHAIRRGEHLNAGIARQGHDIEIDHGQFGRIEEFDLESSGGGRTVLDGHPVHAGELLDGPGIRSEEQVPDRGIRRLGTFSKGDGAGVGPDGCAGQRLVDIEQVAHHEQAENVGSVDARGPQLPAVQRREVLTEPVQGRFPGRRRYRSGRTAGRRFYAAKYTID